MKTAKRANVNWEGYVLIGLIIVYIVAFSYIAYLKYQSFSFHDMDLAAINQAFWNASRGHFIPHQPGESVLFSGHKWVIIFPLIPLYALFPSPLTLLFLQSLALGLGAWAIYLLARDLLNPRFGLLFAFCYLIYPAMNYVNLFEFHPVAFATPLLLFTFYFYYKRKWGLFILFVLLSLSTREDVAIPVFGIGLFALLQGARRANKRFWPRFRWGLIPLFLAILWFTVCTKFTPVKSTAAMESFYSWLGGSPEEIIKNLLFHPGRVLQGVLIKPKLFYLLHLLVPLGFVSLLSPSTLIMALVSLAEGLLSQRFTHFSIRYQYSSIITPFIFISSIYGVRNLLSWKWLAGKERVIFLVILLFSIISARTIGPLFLFPEWLKQWKVTQEDAIREKLVDKIPSQTPVIATFEFTPKLSMRKRLFYFYHVYASSRRPNLKVNIPAAQQTSRYALIDFNDPLTFYDFYTPEGDKDIYEFLTEGKWYLAETVNSVALFKKRRKTNLGLIEEADPGEIEHPINIVPLPQMKLSGYSLHKAKVLGEGVIELNVYFQCLEKMTANLLLNARFTSNRNPDFFFQQPFFAPYRIYPTSRWRPGEVVRQKCNILIPEGAPSGGYYLTLAFLVQKGIGFEGKIIYREPRAFFLP